MMLKFERLSACTYIHFLDYTTTKKFLSNGVIAVNDSL
jgi:hypothetical protein